MKHFNVRVYGILMTDNKVLVSDEFIKGHRITKLPGGGLEFGEGTIECVVREFKEEMDLDIDVVDHFYTTDFFVASAFNPNSQVISIYYTVKPKHEIGVKISEAEFDFDEVKEGSQAFRWIALDSINETNFTFAIDKKIAQLLKQQ
jgi:8-oxo-dGTP diphosphatase